MASRARGLMKVSEAITARAAASSLDHPARQRSRIGEIYCLDPLVPQTPPNNVTYHQPHVEYVEEWGDSKVH
jgi:hypothetical protein